MPAQFLSLPPLNHLVSHSAFQLSVDPARQNPRETETIVCEQVQWLHEIAQETSLQNRPAALFPFSKSNGAGAAADPQLGSQGVAKMHKEGDCKWYQNVPVPGTVSPIGNALRSSAAAWTRRARARVSIGNSGAQEPAAMGQKVWP